MFHIDDKWLISVQCLVCVYVQIKNDEKGETSLCPLGLNWPPRIAFQMKVTLQERAFPEETLGRAEQYVWDTKGKKKLLVTYSAFVIVLCHSHMYWVSKYKHLRVYAELALFCRIVSFFLFRRCYTSFCLILAYTDRCVLMLMCAQLHHHTGTPFFTPLPLSRPYIWHFKKITKKGGKRKASSFIDSLLSLLHIFGLYASPCEEGFSLILIDTMHS